MWAATSTTVGTRQSRGRNLAVTGGPAFPTCQSSVTNRALSNRNTIPFKNLRNLLKMHAEHISNRNTNTTSAASGSPQSAGLLGGANHESQITNHGISIHPVESSPSRVLASPFRRVMRATAPGGGAVMHVTSHISNSQAYFSAHEMPIQTANHGRRCAHSSSPFSALQSRFSIFRHYEVKNENLQD
jgi:hypothetical protein